MLSNLIARCEHRIIFNPDECGLFIQPVSNKHTLSSEKSVIGQKLSKDKVTALFAANSDGSSRSVKTSLPRNMKSL